MSCTTRSRLTKVTRPPAATLASYGIMPNGVIVTVAASSGAAGDGAGAGAGAVDGAAAGATVDGAGPAGVEPQAADVSTSASAPRYVGGECMSRKVATVCRNRG